MENQKHPMKIGIEAQRLFRKKKHGMEVVTLELIKELQILDLTNKYVIFVKDDEDSACLNETENFKIRKLRSSPYPIWEQYLLPKAVSEEGIDILHCTSNTAPIFINIPLIVTIHDIIYLESLNFNGSAYQNFGNLYRKIVVPFCISKSKVIITVSNFERSRIIEHTKINEAKIITVYNAKNNSFKVIEDKILLDKVRRTYLLPEKFILFFGNTAPKKNTKRVLEAYAQYSLSSSEILPLVITDCKESYIRSILRDINQLEVMNNIHVRDYIGFNDLPSVYNLAFIFLYPSLRESFGLPIIESMACGTPVITSNTSSMPEVAGDAAILINPENKDDIALAIERITIDSQKHERMTSAGLQRAGIFDWNSTAREVLKIYHLHQPPRLN